MEVPVAVQGPERGRRKSKRPSGRLESGAGDPRLKNQSNSLFGGEEISAYGREPGPEEGSRKNDRPSERESHDPGEGRTFPRAFSVPRDADHLRARRRQPDLVRWNRM